MADAGWYPDASDPGTLLYWDGQRWTGDRRPAPGQSPAAQPVPEPTPQPTPQPTVEPTTERAAAERATEPANEPSRPPGAQPGSGDWQARPTPYGQGQQPPGGWTPPAAAPQWSGAAASEAPGAPADQQQWGPQQQWGAHAAHAPQSPQAPQGGGQQWGTQAPQGGQEQWAPQQWGTPTTEYPPGAAAQQPAPWQVGPAEPRPTKKKRTLLYVAAAVVVLLVAGLVTWLVWPNSPAPKFTYQGKELTAADDTLSTAESSVNALVQKRHGAKNADTRCYYAQQKQPPSGTKKSDVDQKLRCGPVLFVDGDPAQTYLAVQTTSARDGGKMKLTPQPPADDAEPAAVPADVNLARPDGKTAPQGAGGLKVPNPPAAEANVLTTAELGPTSPPASLTNAVIVGKSVKVTVTSAGEIPRYGAGDDARSAPSGQKLLAFRTLYGAGDVSGGGSARATLVVGGQSRSLPEPDSGEYIIAGVPSSGSATLQLVDGGATQTLALPSGTPGAGNIKVLTRKHRTSFVLKTFNVPVKISKGKSSANLTLRGRVTLASLDYWIPGHTNLHASRPSNAILSMNLSYTRSGQSGTYGFDPQIVRLRLPDGTTVAARNVASAGRIDDVFEVPATFTRGTVLITGTERVSGGITLRVTKTTGFTVSIPAG